MFETFSRSWQFATTSYLMLWRNKSLLIFPILSTVPVKATRPSE